jgi:hypothetical protein
VDLDRGNKGYTGEWGGEHTGLSARALSLVMFLKELIFFMVRIFLGYAMQLEVGESEKRHFSFYRL